jgi:LysR family nod box-dependent transcriptional activator
VTSQDQSCRLLAEIRPDVSFALAEHTTGSNMPRFDLNLIGALQALLTERNVTRAGNRLHVTQPTMSGMLQRLRQQFGDEILVRVGRNMELTPLGQSLVEPVRDALRSIEALANAEPTFDPARSVRTFSMMASDYCALTFLPRIVSRLASIAPGIRLEIRPLNSGIDPVLAGDVDLLVCPPEVFSINHEEDLLHSEILFSDDFVCIVAEDHPLNYPITMEDYLLYPHVGVHSKEVPDTLVSASFRKHVPSYKPTYTVPEFMAIPHMVAGSELIGIVQRRLALMSRKSLPIKMFVPPFALPNIVETLFWHPRHSADLAHSWFRRLLAREAADDQTEAKVDRSTRAHRKETTGAGARRGNLALLR